VRSKPVRKSCKVYGALSLDRRAPKFHFRFEKDKFNAYSFVTFLEGLVRYYGPRGKRVHLIVDGAQYHKTALPWVNAHTEQIELHFLPPYSPQLNAAEQVWRKTKREATHNRYFRTLGALRSALFRRFNRFQGNPSTLRGMVERWL
jgi:transposase